MNAGLCLALNLEYPRAAAPLCRKTDKHISLSCASVPRMTQELIFSVHKSQSGGESSTSNFGEDQVCRLIKARRKGKEKITGK